MSAVPTNHNQSTTASVRPNICSAAEPTENSSSQLFSSQTLQSMLHASHQIQQPQQLLSTPTQQPSQQQLFNSPTLPSATVVVSMPATTVVSNSSMVHQDVQPSQQLISMPQQLLFNSPTPPGTVVVSKPATVVSESSMVHQDVQHLTRTMMDTNEQTIDPRAHERIVYINDFPENNGDEEEMLLEGQQLLTSNIIGPTTTTYFVRQDGLLETSDSTAMNYQHDPDSIFRNEVMNLLRTILRNQVKLDSKLDSKLDLVLKASSLVTAKPPPIYRDPAQAIINTFDKIKTIDELNAFEEKMKEEAFQADQVRFSSGSYIFTILKQDFFFSV